MNIPDSTARVIAERYQKQQQKPPVQKTQGKAQTGPPKRKKKKVAKK